jgi:5-methylthioadenosine/S-adenosylhomocysteine deaminase
MIGGRMVVEGGRVTTVDAAALARRAEEARARLEALNAGGKALFERLAPVVGALGPALAARPYHARRFCAHDGGT